MLAAALDWHPAPSALDGLGERLDEENVAAALAWLASVTSGPAPELRITEAEINRLGYDLLQRGSAGAAATVFRWNVERHPWSANVYDSLADALLALGREAPADEALCRAFAIDPQFDRALDRGLTCAGSALRPRSSGRQINCVGSLRDVNRWLNERRRP